MIPKSNPNMDKDMDISGGLNNDNDSNNFSALPTAAPFGRKSNPGTPMTVAADLSSIAGMPGMPVMPNGQMMGNALMRTLSSSSVSLSGHKNVHDKKINHKLAEQGRRNRMNIAIQDLERLIPDELKNEVLVPSKATTVELASRYIIQLQQQLWMLNNSDLAAPTPDNGKSPTPLTNNNANADTHDIIKNSIDTVSLGDNTGNKSSTIDGSISPLGYLDQAGSYNNSGNDNPPENNSNKIKVENN
ncbi:unnamed protein product [[Candida] boidinii]|nr:unnamed protein product [[Candida] boidinii]